MMPCRGPRSAPVCAACESGSSRPSKRWAVSSSPPTRNLEAAQFLEDLGDDLLGGDLLQVVRALDRDLPRLPGQPQPVALVLLAAGVGFGGADHENGEVTDRHG